MWAGVGFDEGVNRDVAAFDSGVSHRGHGTGSYQNDNCFHRCPLDFPRAAWVRILI